jgi:hypothetical protein
MDATEGRAIGLAETASVKVRPDPARPVSADGSAASARSDSIVTRTIVRPFPGDAGA